MRNVADAFSFPFRDPSWAMKFFIAALFMLLSVVGLGVFVIAGYMIQVTQRVMRREERLLPEWSDVGVKFIVGVKLVAVYLIYLLPVILLGIPFLLFVAIASIAPSSDLQDAVIGVYTFGFTILTIPYAIALAVLFPVISYRFAANERIGEALDIGGVFADFRKQWSSVLLVALIVAGVESFAAVGLVAIGVGVLFTLFYAYLVAAYLHGALYLEKVEGASAS